VSTWNGTLLLLLSIVFPRRDAIEVVQIGEAGWMDSLVRDGAGGGWTDDGYWAKLGFVVCLSVANSSSETFTSLFVALRILD
jgi:hypothetical protein